MVSNTNVMAGVLPSAMEHVEQFLADVRRAGRTVVFFLDFDGTLAPIVANPDEAALPAHTRTVLKELAKQYTTAIVTGRVYAKAKAFIGLDDIIYATSHGFNIAIPDKSSLEMGLEYRPALEATMANLQHIVNATPGALMEDSRQSISVHYRHVPAGKPLEELSAAVEKACATHGVNLHHGKMVYEIRIPIEWHKGKAVEHILRELSMETDEYVPIYIGDDVTDEDAFGVLPQHGGTGVVVFDPAAARSRTSKATLRLKDPYEVCQFLSAFLPTDAPNTNGKAGMEAVQGGLNTEAQTQRAS